MCSEVRDDKRGGIESFARLAVERRAASGVLHTAPQTCTIGCLKKTTFLKSIGGQG